MDERMAFEATITDDGRLQPAHVHETRARLQRWKGKKVFVQVKRFRARRSLTANAYYWVVVNFIAQWSGHEPDEIHEAMKLKFLPERQLVTPHGEELRTPGSSAGLDTFDFAEYVSKVKLWALDAGCRVPEPNEADAEMAI